MLHKSFRVVLFFSFFILLSCAGGQKNKTPLLVEGIPIITSQSDDRQYEVFVLPNGLQALLISDPNTTKAAASLDVNTGSGHNPVSHQGLAHFLEHMLFLGTEKYPISDEYQQFIAAHGGSHNAYTAYENTNYFFDIDAEFLPEILDRFAHFFISPLLSEKYIERERNAVNAEYQARITNEYRRGYAVLSDQMNQDHPAALFSVGNLQTLAGDSDELKQALTHFYNKWYYAKNMRLVVLGKEPLPELKKLVASSFAEIKADADTLERKNTPVVAMYPADKLPLYLEVNSLSDIHNLTISFLLPSDKPYKKYDPLGYISFILGHEGKGSLYHYLRDKGWAETLSAGKSFTSDNESMFSISIGLTSAGVKEKDAVIAHVFQAIHRLQNEKTLNENVFNEIKKIKKIEFDFQQKQQPISYVSSLSRVFHQVNATDVLRANFLLEEFSPTLIQTFLQKMTLQNSVISFQDKSVEGDQASTFFNVKYKVRNLSGELKEYWQQSGINPRITWPEENPYLPEDFSLVSEKKQPESQVVLPRKVSSNKGITLWMGAESDYGLPKGELTVFLRGLNVSKNARNSVLMSLYAAMVQEQLNPQAYLGAMAGLSSTVDGHIDTMTLSINGFSDKQALYARQAIALLAAPEINKDQFELLKTQYQRELNNFTLLPPYQQAFTLTSGVLDPTGITYKAKQEQLASIGIDDLVSFIHEFSQSLQATVLMAGNYSKEQAEEIQQLVRSQYGDQLQMGALPERLVIRAPEQGVTYSEPFAQKDSLYSVFFQGELWGNTEAARFALLGTIIKGDFFDQLRTEQQMGYVVYATEANIKGLPGFFMLVQSPTNSVESIDAAVADFLQSQVARLEGMSAEQWSKFQQSAISRYTQRAKNIDELSGSWAGEIISGRYQFSRRFDVAEQIKNINQKQLVEFFQQLIKANHSVTVTSAKGEELKPAKQHINKDMLLHWQESQEKVKIGSM